MKVTIVGIGMGDGLTLTQEARQAIGAAELLIGAPRMIDAVSSYRSADSAHVEAIRTAEIREALDRSTVARACVLCSGDTGFYSLATTLREALAGYEVETLPGITTVQYLASRIGRPWQGCTLVSAHGLSCNVLGQVLAHRETFFLTGGEVTPESIVKTLLAAGLGALEMTVGERLSYPDECIATDCVSAFAGRTFDTLSSVWIRRGELRDAEVAALPLLAGGIPDEAFIRGKAPMTKQEVRACVIAKLGVRADDVFYDVGAGTGSVSVELALASPFDTVYAVEADHDAFSLIEENRIRFGAYNICPVEGFAPEALDALPMPDAVFVGGSKGNLDCIVGTVLEKNPRVRIVVSAIAMETVAEAQMLFKRLASEGVIADAEVTQVSVSRTRALGSYHLMSAQNPIMLFSTHGIAAGSGEEADA